MSISFQAIRVGALLDAASLVKRPAGDLVKDTDQLDSLIHRNADAHMDQPRGCLINISTAVAERIQEVITAAAPPVPPVEASTEASSGGVVTAGVSVETASISSVVSDQTKLPDFKTDLEVPEVVPEGEAVEVATEGEVTEATEETTIKRRR